MYMLNIYPSIVNNILRNGNNVDKEIDLTDFELLKYKEKYVYIYIFCYKQRPIRSFSKCLFRNVYVCS